MVVCLVHLNTVESWVNSVDNYHNHTSGQIQIEKQTRCDMCAYADCAELVVTCWVAAEGNGYLRNHRRGFSYCSTKLHVVLVGVHGYGWETPTKTTKTTTSPKNKQDGILVFPTENCPLVHVVSNSHHEIKWGEFLNLLQTSQSGIKV